MLSVYQNCPEMVIQVLEFYVDVVDAQISFLEEVGHIKFAFRATSYDLKSYPNRICPSTRIPNVFGFTLVLRTPQLKKQR